MAHPSNHRLCSTGVLRLVVALGCVILVVYLLGPPLLSTRLKNHPSSCPSCSCDCPSESKLSFSLDFLNSSYADCGKHDPDMNEEMKKDVVALLSEELSLQKNVSDDSLEHTKALIMDAKKTSSHYQKEAEKCSTGVEVCEAAREMAEAALTEEHKLSAVWEKRARELGWSDKRRVYS